jgi:hypothetical protein
MGFLKNLFGRNSSTVASKRSIVCQKCRERYQLERIVVVSDDDVMGWLTGGGATVIGKMSGHPVMVGHCQRVTDASVLKTLLDLGQRVGWTCSKCKNDNSWAFSFS